MIVNIVSLFPELFAEFGTLGIVGRASRDGLLTLRFCNPRVFGLGKHRAVDDTPYGGGAGMLMRVDCLVSAMEAVDQEAREATRARRILLCPRGRRFDQTTASRLAQQPSITLVCGRYEGFDERVRAHVDEEVSLGDFVLSGGEVAAMAIIDACIRLVPGVLGNPESLLQESHTPGATAALEYPQYTRPAEYRGVAVPAVLQSGHHANIERWRREQAQRLSTQREARDAGTSEGAP